MKRKYKILIILLISLALTFLIYYYNQSSKIIITSLGDGVADGITNKGMNGLSYNYYLKEKIGSKSITILYDYSKKNKKLLEILEDFTNNKEYIKQKVYKSDIITVFFGEEELSKISILNDLDDVYMKEYIEIYDVLIKEIRNNTEGKIYILGLYTNAYLDNNKVIYMNSNIADIASKYNCLYIDTKSKKDSNSIYLTNSSNIDISMEIAKKYLLEQKNVL